MLNKDLIGCDFKDIYFSQGKITFQFSFDSLIL